MRTGTQRLARMRMKIGRLGAAGIRENENVFKMYQRRVIYYN
jgi:hypothetical protein